ncbi:hypothetical protein LY78DRAFT_98007 [Colletotrichum sublineola]|nr:hypothetical protein LY78DRAFT_98007 [Colletotrichum sublineola]
MCTENPLSGLSIGFMYCSKGPQESKNRTCTSLASIPLHPVHWCQKLFAISTAWSLSLEPEYCVSAAVWPGRPVATPAPLCHQHTFPTSAPPHQSMRSEANHACASDDEVYAVAAQWVVNVQNRDIPPPGYVKNPVSTQIMSSPVFVERRRALLFLY